MQITRAQVKQEGLNTVYDLIASFGWMVGVSLFAAPNGIAPGGIWGISVLLNYLFRLPIGTMSLLFNVPLLILAYRVLGRTFVVRTLRTLLCYTILTDVIFANPSMIYRGDPLLAALYGGIFSGAGTALIFMHGSTSGGTDIVNRLIQRKYPHLSAGQISMVLNAVVMCLAAIVYRNINAALYGLIYSFSSSRVMDTILNGIDMGKCVLVVTRRPQEISRHIIEELHRSATILDGKGAYLQDEVSVLMCVVRKPQFYRLKKFVAQCDPGAFVVITDATQIIGRGFRPIDA